MTISPQTSPLRIGLLIDGLLGWYQTLLWQGVANVAKTHKANLTIFIGRELDSPIDFESQANIIYNMISSKNIDGLVINTGVIGGYKSDHEIAAFCRQFSPLPIVTLAKNIPGLSGVTIETEQSVRDLMAHLIEVHNYRRIAFIAGPAKNIDAQIRLQIYKEMLKQFDLPLNPNLIVPGSFTYQSGYAAAKYLLEQQTGNFDAIFAADDATAFGVLAMLHKKGIRIPKDVAVVGFDDDGYSANAIPPLTTVRQPVYQQSQRATELLLAHIKGQTRPQRATLPTQQVIRQSCGCPSLNFRIALVNPKIIPKATITQPQNLINDAEVLALIRQELRLPSFITLTQIEELLGAFTTALNNNNPALFVDTFTTMLQPQAAAAKDINNWHPIISYMRYHIAKNHIVQNEKSVLAEEVWQQARVIISEHAQQAQAIHSLKIEQTTGLLREISNALTASYELPEIMDLLAQELPRLGIAQTYLSLFENPHMPLDRSRLILAYNRQGRLKTDQDMALFSTSKLIPDTIQPDQTYTPMIILPLFFKREPLGFALFELNHKEDRIYEIIRGQLSSALKGALLLQQVQDHANQLETEVANRTHALTAANNRLQLYTTELERSNQELQAFAYVASHDLQEPLRKIQIFGSRLDARYATILGGQGQDYIKRINNAASRMQTLIEDLLKLSRITTKARAFTPVDLNEIIYEVLLDLETRLHDVQGQVDVKPLPTIKADKTQMRQLFQNLIGNALKFHKPDSPPIIRITGHQLPDSGQNDPFYQISIRDNGIGFNEMQAERIFGVFQRLHGRTSYEGTGVGLAICRKITDRHRGTITATGNPNEGATFVVTLPMLQ